LALDRRGRGGFVRPVFGVIGRGVGVVRRVFRIACGGLLAGNNPGDPGPRRWGGGRPGGRRGPPPPPRGGRGRGGAEGPPPGAAGAGGGASRRSPRGIGRGAGGGPVWGRRRPVGRLAPSHTTPPRARRIEGDSSIDRIVSGPMIHRARPTVLRLSLR